MKDETIIVIVKLLIGFGTLIIHVVFNVNHILIFMVCILWGVPLDLLWKKEELDKLRKKVQKLEALGK